MTQVPRSVMVIQSPCRHMPGYTSKYASRYRSPVSSPQKPTGMLGIGAVMTSSPSWPMTGSPLSSNASTFAPRQRQEISPSYTGSSGEPPTNPVQTSVPPDSEDSRMCSPTASYTQRKPSGGGGAPVGPPPRSAARSAASFGTIPALRQASRNGADVPK